jgi:GNAT superfamily N-acetyltransferase
MATIRPAMERDLAEMQHIYYLNEIQGNNDPPPLPTETPLTLKHIVETGTAFVAEQDGRVIGHAAAITRGSIAYLTDLFVHPALQSSHVGTTLLQHAFPLDTPLTHCTCASTDHRAIALYIRAGMQPQWPHFNLRLTEPVRDARWQSPIKTREASADLAEFELWDTRLSGRSRPQEHAFWRQQQRAVPLWFYDRDEIVGYGYVRLGARTLWFPNACTIGPLGINTSKLAADCVLAAVDWALHHTDMIHIDVPGPHPCLAPLLERGFRIVYVETFVSQAASPFFDARRYIASGSDLL